MRAVAGTSESNSTSHGGRDIADGEMAGAVGLIARHGKIVYFETYGMADRESNRAMTKDSIFRLAIFDDQGSGSGIGNDPL